MSIKGYKVADSFWYHLNLQYILFSSGDPNITNPILVSHLLFFPSLPTTQSWYSNYSHSELLPNSCVAITSQHAQKEGRLTMNDILHWIWYSYCYSSPDKQNPKLLVLCFLHYIPLYWHFDMPLKLPSVCAQPVFGKPTCTKCFKVPKVLDDQKSKQPNAQSAVPLHSIQLF